MGFLGWASLVTGIVSFVIALISIISFFNTRDPVDAVRFAKEGAMSVGFLLVAVMRFMGWK